MQLHKNAIAALQMIAAHLSLLLLLLSLFEFEFVDPFMCERTNKRTYVCSISASTQHQWIHRDNFIKLLYSKFYFIRCTRSFACFTIQRSIFFVILCFLLFFLRFFSFHWCMSHRHYHMCTILFHLIGFIHFYDSFIVCNEPATNKN